MSGAPETYACEACTFIQSIKRSTCEMCDRPNPHFGKPASRMNAKAAAMFNRPERQHVVECYHCNYINIGSHIESCEGCGKVPYNTGSLLDRIPFAKLLRRQSATHDEKAAKSSGDNEFVKPKVVEEPAKSSLRGKLATASGKKMQDDELVSYFNRYIHILTHQEQEDSLPRAYLHECLTLLFNMLESKSEEPSGQLAFPTCQICCDESQPIITMKTCGHSVICANDFHRYLSVRINEGDILPWIPCPAETCFVPCHVEDMMRDGHLTNGELASFITRYMFRTLCRNENFITCIKCGKGGFLQMGPPKQQVVRCPMCREKQTIEKGVSGELDLEFKKMIKAGHLRECPACRHLTFKEKGICNVLECAKCGIWWNWKTGEQGNNGRELKQRARANGTLWEPGELRYQQELEARDPQAFKALLERNGVKYDPNYVRGGWGHD